MRIRECTRVISLKLESLEISVLGVSKKNLNPMEARSGGIDIDRGRVGVRGCGMVPSPDWTQSGPETFQTVFSGW